MYVSRPKFLPRRVATFIFTAKTTTRRFPAYRDQKDRRDENGQRLVVRNGHLPEREIVTGIGPIKVRQPRVRHRDEGRFSSAILPRFMRRTPSLDALIPALYLKGISTGDFTEALAAILGEKASVLSTTNIVRLKVGWEADYKAWEPTRPEPEALRLLAGRRRLLQCPTR